MANTVGDVAGSDNAKKSICLMTGQSANNTAPTLATDGVPCYPDNNVGKSTGHCYTTKAARESTILIHTTGGSGALTGIFTLWGYHAASGDWYPVKVNGGSAVAGTGKVQYQERLLNLGHYDRLFLQIASIGGTTPTFEAWLVTAQQASQ